MKKLLLLLITSFAIVFISCEENFSPKEEFKDGYILYGIIASDDLHNSQRHEVYISKLYDVEGYDPGINLDDPTVSGANVVIEYRNNFYTLTQAERNRVDTSRYKNKLTYYYTNQIAPLPNNPISIMAEMPDGKFLSSSTYIPDDMVFEYSYDFDRTGINPKLNQFLWGDKWIINWSSYQADYRKHLYFPQLTIYYEKNSSTGVTSGKVKIPSTFIKRNGIEEPYFVPFTYGESVTFDFEAIDKTLNDISKDDTAKSSYSVGPVIFEVIEFDANLSSYYSSINGSLDAYSISLDEIIFSNINNGTGVFGSYKSNKRSFNFNSNYIKEIGYKIKY
jgi:hypothetical protein